MSPEVLFTQQFSSVNSFLLNLFKDEVLYYYHRGKSSNFPSGPVGYRCCTPNAEGLGSTPGQETRSHILQLTPNIVK